MIEPHGGVIVAEYFDVGESRSLPWQRRPQAAALLKAMADPGRGFSAIVIGEPHRMFYGNQFGLIFPLFVHYGIDLWVPELGGRLDPTSDAQDLMMLLFGGLSKAERNRIKIRVRSAMAAQAKIEGRFLGGRPPYGYRLADAGPHPNPSKAAIGQRLHRLEPDPVAAPVVRRIYAEYLSGKGIYAVAELLTRDGIPSPAAHDPARNRHRDGRAWSKSAVRVILLNPRYTGRQVWNRQRRDEVLLDVDDVAAGHQTKLRWNDRAEWVWSTDPSHEALVSAEDFAAVQAQMAVHAHRHIARKPRAAKRPYVLSGLLWCGACGRRMQGSHNHGAAHYRCRFAAEYGIANAIDHPKTIYVRESVIVPGLDRWLGRLFDPDHLDRTIDELAAHAHADPAGDEASAARAEAARRKLADCDDRLARYRAALDGGADPALVAGWLAEVQADRLASEKKLATLTSDNQTTPRSPDEIRRLIESLGDVPKVLSGADPTDKARLYAALGLTITYDATKRRITVEARPDERCALARVGGGTGTISTPPVWRTPEWAA